MSNIVLEYADNYGVYIDRDVKVSAWNNGRETGTLFVGSGKAQKLSHIEWTDLDDMGIWRRGADGSFAGCSNSAWYITEDEAAALIALNNDRAEKYEAGLAAREAAEEEYERNRQAVLKMMDDDAEHYC